MTQFPPMQNPGPINLPAPLRLDAVKQWLSRTIGTDGFSIEPASSDASFRRYYRVTHQGASQIVMDAPPSHENCRPFVKVAQLFYDLGLHVPRVLEADLENGFLLLDDLGPTLYLSVLSAANASQLYGDATASLIKLHRSGKQDLAPYDHKKLHTEMSLFPQWFMAQHLQISPEPYRDLLNKSFEQLSTSALAQPIVAVHLDFHSRNLTHLPEKNPGILDFQDAVMGPITYDLASLYRDCYIRWPTTQVEQWVQDYSLRLKAEGLIDAAQQGQFQQWFDMMGAQRHLKAVGIFARLNHRDGKPGYLKDIPRTLNYITEVCERYDALKEFGHFIRQVIHPAMLQKGMALL